MASNFNNDLNYSNRIQASSMWLEIYQKAFTDYQSLEIVPGLHPLQAEGVDRILITESGKTRYVEEKADKHQPKNLYLEYMSALEYNTPGWIQKPVQTDYLIYAYPAYGVAYLFRFKFLQAVWQRNKRQWIRDYGKEAQTFGHGGVYTSLGCAVPLDVLQTAIDKFTRLPGAYMKRIEFLKYS